MADYESGGFPDVGSLTIPKDDFGELVGIFDGKKTAVAVTEDDMPIQEIGRGVEKAVEEWLTTKS